MRPIESSNQARPKIIKIRIENYKKETPELLAEFKKLGLQEFDSLDFQFKQIPAGTYHVETDYIFGNQYNTAEGIRIFEKCSALHSDERGRLKKGGGYYIAEGIDELRAYQDKVKVCGYCGAQYYETEKTVCDKCAGSEYLKETELHLLRLLPVRESFGAKRKLTEAEHAELLEKYRTAQGLGKINRQEAAKSKNRQKVASLIPEAEGKAAALIEAAKIETDAYTWLLDHGVNILENTIYYTHTGRFCFGWRNPLTDDEKSKLLDILCEFPFDYDIK